MTATLLLALALAQAPAPDAAGSPDRTLLTLDDAVRLARDNAPSLRAARAGADAADARVRQSLAPLLPQLSGSASWERATSNSGLPFAPDPTLDMGGQLTLSATASQAVVDLPAYARWRASRASARAEAGSARAAELEAVLAARTAWFQARATRALAAVAKAALENQEAHFRKVDAFVTQGMRPPIDLAQARSDRATAKAQLVAAENDYATARVRLNQAMGVVGPIDYDVATVPFPAVEGEDRPLEALLEEAIAALPDLAAQEALLQAAEGSVRAAQGGYLPRLGFSAGATDAGPDAGDLTWNAWLGATLSWNLFQGGLTAGQVAEARAAREAQRAQRDLILHQVRADVDSARLAVRAALALLEADQEAVEAARERQRLAEARYASGAGSALELSDAILSRTSAEAQLVQAEYQLASARAQLLRALGRG